MSAEEDLRVTAAVASQITEYAKKVESVLALTKVLIGGAFALGCWVAGVQFQLNQQRSDIDQIIRDRAASQVEWREWRERIGEDMAEMRSDIRWMRENVNLGQGGKDQ